MLDGEMGHRALLGAAGLLWLAALLLPITTRGVGSALPGHELADLAGAGRLPDIPSWLGPAWYVMPLGGGVVIASLGLAGRPASVVRWAAATAASSSALIFTVHVTDLDVGRFGAGAWTAIAGSALAACGLVTTVVQRRRQRGPRNVL